MHGGTTHFPIALVMTSMLFDLIAFLVPDSPDRSRRAGFRSAAFYTLLLGALVSLAAVLSGLMISHGQLWGRGDLARHHGFLWPAFGLTIGLAVWRLTVRDRASESALKAYLALSMLTAALMGAAGYWGGELLLNR